MAYTPDLHSVNAKIDALRAELIACGALKLPEPTPVEKKEAERNKARAAHNQARVDMEAKFAAEDKAEADTLAAEEKAKADKAAADKAAAEKKAEKTAA